MSLDDKIIPGYAYHIKRIYPDGPTDDSRDVFMCTGQGGAKMFIESMRKWGHTDEEIEEMISIYTDDWGQVSIKHLKVTKKDLEKS